MTEEQERQGRARAGEPAPGPGPAPGDAAPDGVTRGDAVPDGVAAGDTSTGGATPGDVPSGGVTPGWHDEVARACLRHPVRAALLALVRARGTLTSTDAARELGGSSGLHSFHLRQLARYGFIEPVPTGGGRQRPWRPVPPPAGGAGSGHDPAAGAGVAAGAGAAAEPGPAGGPGPAAGPELDRLARGLEDESYHRWLARRGQAPARWQRDEAFSQVLYLTPRELTGLGAEIRELIARYRHREQRPATRPPGAAPVAVIARLFPLLDPEDRPADR